MTTDPFTEAARAEAESRYVPEARLPVMKPTDRMDDLPRRCAIDGFTTGAEWGREQALAQEPTEAEREAVMEALGCRLRSLVNGQTTCDEHGRRASTDDVCWAADAALSAARAARRDEEKR